jgi:hypothetical protein
VYIAGTEDSDEEILFILPVKLQRVDYRQIAERAVGSIEEAVLLCSMCSIIGWIQIDSKAAILTFQSVGMLLDNSLGQIFCYLKQAWGIDRVYVTFKIKA